LDGAPAVYASDAAPSGLACAPADQIIVLNTVPEKNVLELAVTATDIVFLVSSTVSAVKRIPKSGGDSVTLASGSVIGLTADDTAVYWGQVESTPNAASIRTIPLDGGGPPVALVQGLSLPIALVVDAENLYWVDFTAGEAVVGVVPTGGGAATDIAKLPHDFPGVGEPRLALDQGNLYLRGMHDGISAVPRAGGTVTTFDAGYGPPVVALDEGFLAFATFGAATDAGAGFGTVEKVDTMLTSSTVLVPNAAPYPIDVVARAGTVYYSAFDSTFDAPPIMKLDARGGADPVPVVCGDEARGMALAVDDARLYWFDWDAGAIKSAPR
jgi:hypothetical protein